VISSKENRYLTLPYLIECLLVYKRSDVGSDGGVHRTDRDRGPAVHCATHLLFREVGA
jgi:hypothetical protein